MESKFNFWLAIKLTENPFILQTLFPLSEVTIIFWTRWYKFFYIIIIFNFFGEFFQKFWFVQVVLGDKYYRIRIKIRSSVLNNSAFFRNMLQKLQEQHLNLQNEVLLSLNKKAVLYFNKNKYLVSHKNHFEHNYIINKKVGST